MKHGTLPSARHSGSATAASTALALLLGATVQHTSAQNQSTGEQHYTFPLYATGFTVEGNVGPDCGSNYTYALTANSDAPTVFPDTSRYISVPAGFGPQSFYINLNYFNDYAYSITGYQVYMDGVYCSSCTVDLVNGPQTAYPPPNSFHVERVKVNYSAGNDAWTTKGVHVISLRPVGYGGFVPLSCEWRIPVVMVGTTFTSVLGYYDAPALPLYIMRDPPGGQSFSSISTNSSTCFGKSQSVTNDQEEGGWFKAKLGIAGSAGLFVTKSFEFYVEAGVNISASQSQTSEYEYKTCVEQGSELTTSDNGTPDDVFYVTAIKYAYGMAIKIERPSCGVVTKHAAFVSQPFEVNHSYHYNESYIRNSVVPQAQQQLAQLTPGTDVYKQAEQQLSVWHQMLDMNDSIKADAAPVITRSFNGGGTSQTYDLTRTTETMRSIEYTASLSTALSLEFCVEIGGSGVSGGAEVKLRDEYGNGQTNSNVSTNTMSYTLKDPDVFDNFDVIVGADNVFGTYTFTLDSATSRTSCRYEGGYQIDNPELFVGSIGNESMTVNEAPIGTSVTFPLILHNASDTSRTYFLKINSITNGAGGIWQAFGNTIGSNDQGIQLNFLGNQTITANLTLTQPNNSVVDFDNVTFYLYSLCDEDYPPYIRSYVSLSAHYGVGNFGSYCTPVSDVGTTLGDFVNGVQLANINNTNTGGITGPSYTDYTSQFTTPLSRNAQKICTITSGTNAGDRFAAWIDYDHNGTFDANEKLGEFTNGSGGQAQNITFTVPNTAVLGSTIMRVRGIGIIAGEPSPLDPCFNYHAGETEDYAVVINANVPQDCAGVNNGPALPGTACNDNNANTGNDAWNANCLCAGLPLDCAGTPGGFAVTGTPCDDGNANTGMDVYSVNCACAGIPFDCLGVLGGAAMEDSPCDDGNAGTGNDTWGPNCVCAGQVIDCLGVIGGTTLTGTACDDGNPLSGGDAYNVNCQCVGSFSTDCAGVENGTAQPGTACNDNNAATGNDVYGVNCVCAGLPFDCAGTPGGTQVVGTPCDDGNSETDNDTFTANCACQGTLATDCAGVLGGTAQPGTACDDGNAATGNDVYDNFCNCAGQTIDCNGVPGGGAQPGNPCDDGNAATGNDVLSANCECAGLLIDCLGSVGGTALPGTACDDGNPNSTGDAYNANCACVGSLANDCLGVPGGTAQPGTACDDGNANTGNDVYSANCECTGQLIDCANVIGGTALPGTACDDGNACTTADVWSAGCVCVGSALSAGTVNGPSTVDEGASITCYIVPVAGATSYSWTLPGDWTSDNTSAFVLVAQAGQTAGAVNVCVDATVGTCVLTSCLPVQVMGPSGINATPKADEWFTLQPNPSYGVFQLLPSSNDNTPIAITIHDGTGRQVMDAFTIAGQRAIPIDLGNMAAGAYYLLATRNGQHQAMKVMVQR